MAEFRVAPFSGQVLDGTTFRPIAGARVQALLLETGQMRVADGYPPVLDEQVSGPDGRFQFSDRTFGAAEILGWRAEAPNFHRMLLLFPAGEGLGDRLRSTFLLRASGGISGEVVDEKGEPIGGALVGDLLLGEFAQPGTPGENAIASAWTESNADGTFELGGLEMGETFRLPVRAEGYVDHRTEPIAVGSSGVVIKLVRAEGAVAGQVLDWEGKPVRGAVLELLSVDGKGGGSPRRTTGSGADGRFQFSGLVAGAYRLTAELKVPESLGPGCKTQAEFGLVSGTTKELQLTLPAPARLAGRFVEEATGRGVAGVRIQSPIEEALARERAFSVVSDADGAFAFTSYVPADARGYEVRLPIVWGSEWYPAPQQADGIRAEQSMISFFAVQPGETREGIEVKLAAGRRLEGIVIEPDGTTPAGGVPVFARGGKFFDSTTADGAGKFQFVVPAEETLKVEASSDLGIAVVQVEPGSEGALRIELQPYGVLEGVLVTDAGEAVKETVIAIQRTPDRHSPKDSIRFTEKGMTRDDGTWRIDHVAPGALSVLPEVSFGLGFAPVKPQALELGPGETRTGIRLVLEEGDFVEGYVYDYLTGLPIPRATLFTSMREISTQTDEEGRFRLMGVPYDTAIPSVTATASGYGEETRRNVSIYDKEVIFRLKPATAVRVKVEDLAGAPVSAFRVRLISFAEDNPGGAGQAVREVVANAPSGVEDLGSYPVGAYRAEVVQLLPSGTEGSSGAADFSIKGTGTAPQEVLVRVGREGTLAGRVVQGENGVAGASVELLNPPLNRGGTGPDGGLVVESDGSGGFSYGALPEGRYQLRAKSRGLASGVASVDLVQGSAPVVLALNPVPRVAGTLNSADGSPVARATIFVMEANGGAPAGTFKGRDGRYEIDLPGAGAWQLAFSEDETPNVITRVVEVEAGALRELNIDFGGRVKVTGRILVNGQAAKSGTTLLLRSAVGEDALAVPGPDGSYSVEVTPGEYAAWYAAGEVMAPTGQRASVGSTDTVRDWSVAVGSLDLLVIDGGAGVEGRLQLRSGGTTVLSGFRVNRPSIRFLELPEGNYDGELTRDGATIGSATGIAVRAGEASTMTIETKPAEVAP
jgi:hypothetical protein